MGRVGGGGARSIWPVWPNRCRPSLLLRIFKKNMEVPSGKKKVLFGINYEKMILILTYYFKNNS